MCYENLINMQGTDCHAIIQVPMYFISACLKLRWWSTYTWLDNKVHELATMCLPWQHWTKALVWFDTLTYQRFTAVLLLIYGSLFLNGIHYCCVCFGVPQRECWSLN